jgi:hypothetical protein
VADRRCWVPTGCPSRIGLRVHPLSASCVGLLLAPYSLIYGAGLLPVAARAAVRASPRAVLGLAITAPVALVLAFPAWVGLALGFAALVPAEAWPSPGSAMAQFRASVATPQDEP